MKTRWLLTILLCLCLCATVLMASCDEIDADTPETSDDATTTEETTEETETDAPTHEHEYADEYSSDDKWHWYACTVEGCDDADGREGHAFGEPTVEHSDNAVSRTYTCTVCGYEKVDTVTVDSIVAGEQAWQDAFTNLRLLNFKLEVQYLMNGVVEHTNICRVTPDAAYYHIESQEEYYAVSNGDGTCATYYRDPSTGNDNMYKSPFILLDDTSDRYLKAAQIETVIKISFADHFDEFTYDAETASYLCDGPVEAESFGPDGTSYGTLRCINNRVKVQDGEIVFIDCDYYLESDDDMYHLNYSDIGTTVVTVPDDVAAGAIERPGYEPDWYNDADNEDREVGYEVGDRAPDGYVELYKGELTALEAGFYMSEYDMTRVIHYWGAWSESAAGSLADLDSIAQKYYGFAAVIAIHSSYLPDMGKAYVEENFWKSKIVFGQDTGDESYFHDMGGDDTWPMTVILDADGTVIWRQVGEVDEATISAVLNDMIGIEL